MRVSALCGADVFGGSATDSPAAELQELAPEAVVEADSPPGHATIAYLFLPVVAFIVLPIKLQLDTSDA